MSNYSIIVAIDENNAIGHNNQMLVHLPDDLKYFKKVTQGHAVIMGRKTFESLPKGALPNRRNIVITRNKDLQFNGCEMTKSLNEALDLVKDDDNAFIIGGGEIYQQAMNNAHVLYITQIHHKFENTSVFFPKIDSTIWEEEWRENHLADEKHPYSFSSIRYIRK